MFITRTLFHSESVRLWAFSVSFRRSYHTHMRHRQLAVLLTLASTPGLSAFVVVPVPRCDVISPPYLARGDRRAALSRDGLLMMAPPPKVKSSYYKRPSAALERGGGFYVPGLEGVRLRVAVASVLTIGLVLNRILSPTGDGAPATSQTISEALGAVGIAFVFAQSAVQSKLEADIERDELRAAFVSRLSEVQEVGGALADGQWPTSAAARARWAASALLKLTPARAAVWVDANGGIMLRFGRFPDDTASESSADFRTTLAPPNGAAASGAAYTVELGESRPPSPLPSNAESVAVCRCGGGIFALASERSEAFATDDLRWLERCMQLIQMTTPVSS